MRSFMLFTVSTAAGSAQSVNCVIRLQPSHQFKEAAQLSLSAAALKALRTVLYHSIIETYKVVCDTNAEGLILKGVSILVSLC